MHKPFHLWIDLFKRLGLRPAGSLDMPPSRPRGITGFDS